MPDHEVAFYLADGGQNAATRGERLPNTQYARAVNVAIVDQLPTTRPDARVIPQSGDSLEHFETENVQGAMYFNPAEGQGAIVFGRDESMIMLAVGGRKFAVHLDGQQMFCTARLEDVTNGLVSDGNLHLVYLSQWENYVLAGDGNGNTWIWDGNQPAFLSPGYNTTDKEASRVPNGGTVMVYSHGKGSIVVNGRGVLTSDDLNSTTLTGPQDVLAFRQQVYWATGQYFVPPTKMGRITAAKTYAIKDTQHGHGDTLFHCERGIFSINLNVYPRSSWSSTPMVGIAYLGGGATGPYAVAVMDGDQIFRTQAGIQTFRSARGESSLIGNPLQPISDQVATFFAADSPHYLRFSSVERWPAARKAFVTCYPIVSGRWRWHRGIVSLNFDPTPVAQTPPAWESLWTLPPQAKGIIQLVSGQWDGTDRLFAICRGNDQRNRIVEFQDTKRGEDTLADGTRQQIRCQLQTRKVDVQKPFMAKNFQGGTLYLANVTGCVKWQVLVRPYKAKVWTVWQSGCIDACPKCEPDCTASLCSEEPTEIDIPLGRLPDKFGENSSRHVAFLIRWAGYCSIEALRLIVGERTDQQDTFDPARLTISLKTCDANIETITDWEYGEQQPSESWIASL